VPENGLLVRRDVDPAVTARLGELLTAMHEDPEGRKALERFGAERFLPCSAEEYSAVYDMVEQLESVWGKVQVAGPAPKRRGARPSTQPVATPAD
jgi:ABC-type phosphate/phosphonate transport system substrate-binding protein